MMKHVDLPEGADCLFRSNHVSNYVQFKVTLPQEKDRLLEEIAYASRELHKLKRWDVYNYS